MIDAEVAIRYKFQMTYAYFHGQRVQELVT